MTFETSNNENDESNIESKQLAERQKIESERLAKYTNFDAYKKMARWIMLATAIGGVGGAALGVSAVEDREKNEQFQKGESRPESIHHTEGTVERKLNAHAGMPISGGGIMMSGNRQSLILTIDGKQESVPVSDSIFNSVKEGDHVSVSYATSNAGGYEWHTGYMVEIIK